ncbi:hypothetical protein [Plantactinospora sp. GCM10030261]|uniref:hypothetical protein n=1 Tax=Plantactinospora sp. GCM10030261 TaxID=3273420 RepID=UPI0036085D17
MTTLFRRLGDRALGLFLDDVEAGACVPEHGDYCGCKPSGGYCSGGIWYRYYRRATFNCSGSCVTSSSASICYTERTQLGC